MDIAAFKEQLKKLPSKPGIYLFKNSRNKPLYIGKALNLKNRVKNYSKTDNPRTQRAEQSLYDGDSRLIKMLAEAAKIDFILTKSDIEALILESQYIKRYQPAFNIMLRDDKQYFYVGFSNDEFPRIFLTHQPNKIRNSNIEIRNKFKIQNSKFETISDFGFRASYFSYIGPFTDGSAIKTVLRLLRKIFPYCTCKQPHNNYCLNYHIGKCPGFCCLKNNGHKNNEQKTYLKNIKAIKDILSGKKSSLVKNLEHEMQKLAKEEKYEKASELQNKIEKLKRVFENARIIHNLEEGDDSLRELARVLGLKSPPHRIEAYDIANIQGDFAVGAMVVFTEGKSDINEYRKFKIHTKKTADDTGMLREILTRRFNHPEWSRPDLILVDGGKGQLNAVSSLAENILVIALTKNEYHIGHKLTLPGKEILLSRLPIGVKNLTLRIDSEAHRFAISYYRKLHGRSVK